MLCPIEAFIYSVVSDPIAQQCGGCGALNSPEASNTAGPATHGCVSLKDTSRAVPPEFLPSPRHQTEFSLRGPAAKDRERATIPLTNGALFFLFIDEDI